MQHLSNFFFAALVGTAMLLHGCSGSHKSTRATKRTSLPPGLDSSTVAQSNKFAKKNFVSDKREQQAAQLATLGRERLQKVDEFWAVLENSVNEHAQLSVAQKTEFDRDFNAGAESLSRWKNVTRNGAENRDSWEAKNHCFAAQKFLENALRLNPFDRNARMLLASVYYNLQYLFGLEKNHAKAVEVLERLARLEKGEPAVYRALADNYMALKEYQAALRNYRAAEQVALATAFMTPPDTSMRFHCLYGQGDALARLHEGEAAVLAFEKARAFAKTAAEQKDLSNYVDWVNWDGGNTRASEQWDKILALEAQKEFAQTAAACREIFPLLKTMKAGHAVTHKLAVLEFEYLKKTGIAVARMQQLFEALPLAEREAPKEETTRVYLNTYGAMLYRLGVEARKRDQKKTSLAYFTKAVSFPWDNLARAALELMPLVLNSPEASIKYGKLALAAAHALTPEERCQLRSYMIKAYKSAGQFHEARTMFEDWKKCQGEEHAQN